MPVETQNTTTRTEASAPRVANDRTDGVLNDVHRGFEQIHILLLLLPLLLIALGAIITARRRRGRVPAMPESLVAAPLEPTPHFLRPYNPTPSADFPCPYNHEPAQDAPCVYDPALALGSLCPYDPALAPGSPCPYNPALKPDSPCPYNLELSPEENEVLRRARSRHLPAIRKR